MSEEYRAKVFKSGNSLALRLPKALGLKEGEEMVVREDHGRFQFEPAPPHAETVSLKGIYGSIPDLKRPPADATERDWDMPGDAG